MARELRVVHNASINAYAILRRESDDYVWNGSTFVVWVDGDIANYDIPLTSRGGDLYTADFPSGVDAGAYSVYYYRRVGATPATDDEFLGGKGLYWNGDEVSTTPTTYLTTLVRLKRYMGITSSSYDTKLNEMLAAASRYIENYCGTKFLADDYVEIRNGKGDRAIRLNNIPVQRITRIASAIDAALLVTYTGAGEIAFVRVTDPGIVLESVAAGVSTSNTLAFADNVTLENMKTAIEAIAGWTVTINTDFAGRASADLLATQGAYAAKNAPAELLMARYSLYMHRFSPESGLVWGRFPQGYRNIEVRYRAGYDSVPDDVQNACCMIAKGMYDMASRDTTLQSERIGDYSYTTGSMSSREGIASISLPAASLLAPYINVSFA